MFKLSKSRMGTLFSCPLNYYFKYILKPSKTDKVEDHYLTAGLYIHETLENIYTKINEDEYINLDIIDKIEYLIDKFDLNITGDPLVDEITKLACDNFIKWQCKMDRKYNGYYKPFMTEKYVEMELSQDFINFFIENYPNLAASIKIKNLPKLEEPIILNGYIDRVDYLNNEYSILDYKSKVTSIKAYELALYTLMASVNLKLPITHVSVFGYKDGSYTYKKIKPNNIIFGLYKIIDFMNLKNKYENIINRFPRKKGFFCRWCEWQTLCQKYNSRGELKK